MKRYFPLLLLALLLCLAGCGECEHQWSDATCELPKTCTLCGATEGVAFGHSWQSADCERAKTCVICQKTEGEALGHSWQDADCLTAKTCSLCGHTEGDALGHSILPANYQTAATCSACGYTEGELLTPKFAEYSVAVIPAKLGVEYDYLADCYIQGYTTLGKLVWEDYQVFSSDDTHPGVEGYEWHQVTVRITFSDRNAQKYGIVVHSALDDYYWYTAQTQDGYTDQFTVSYNGQLFDQCLRANSYGTISPWENNSCSYTATFAWRVPVDYDGHLILFYRGMADVDEGLKQGDADMLVFRFTD